MEEKTEKFYVGRKTHQAAFDKRLIRKIVSEVEAGLPRGEARRMYGFGKSVLDQWMRKYGSEEYHKNKRRSYSRLQKRTIASAIDQGRMTIPEAQTAYQIKNEGLIRNWLRAYRSEKADLSAVKKDTTPQEAPACSRSGTEALEKALKEAELKIQALNTLIDVAEQQLKIDIRKKSGARQSSK